MKSQLNITVASNFWLRFKGLMLTKPLAVDAALLIPRCSSVHTFFMRFALDLVYLNKQGSVVKLVKNVKPWRMSWGGAGATQTLEMTTGGIERFAIQQGDQLVATNSVEKSHVFHTT